MSSRLCPRPSCMSFVDEDGEERKLQTPLWLMAYHQPGTNDGLLFAWVCKVCGYDSSLEAFASRPEYSWTHRTV